MASGESKKWGLRDEDKRNVDACQQGVSILHTDSATGSM